MGRRDVCSSGLPTPAAARALSREFEPTGRSFRDSLGFLRKIGQQIQERSSGQRQGSTSGSSNSYSTGKKTPGEPGHAGAQGVKGTQITPTNLTTIQNPGDPEKGERSSLFKVLARTPFNSCSSYSTFFPGLSLLRAPPRLRPAAAGSRRVGGRSCSQRSKLAIDLRAEPLPAADSEEAAPSEPDPASTRSQSASPRLLEGGRRNEGARGRWHA